MVLKKKSWQLPVAAQGDDKPFLISAVRDRPPRENPSTSHFGIGITKAEQKALEPDHGFSERRGTQFRWGSVVGLVVVLIVALLTVFLLRPGSGTALCRHFVTEVRVRWMSQSSDLSSIRFFTATFFANLA